MSKRAVEPMTRWLLAAVLLLAGLDVAACPLCLRAYQSSPAQKLVDMRKAVLVKASAEGTAYRVVAVVKGEPPAHGVIDASAVQLKDAPAGNTRTLLLVSDDAWPMWVSIGAIGTEHAGWLRQLAAGKRATDMNGDDWRARLALLFPYLEHREPLAAEIAYAEFAAAPYATLVTVKPRLAAPAVRRWLGDPKLAERQALYLLLLGIAGYAQDATVIERRLDAAWATGDTTNLGSLLAADLELRGPARMAWVDDRYLRDRKRSTKELEAVLLALSVHGNANGVIPRERVIQSYRTFMQEHKDIAGFVAQDLAAWRYWDAVPEYVALLRSDVRQQYPSRVAIVMYLRQSPAGRAGTIALPHETGADVLSKSTAAPVVPQ